jgi:hypothetical protein
MDVMDLRCCVGGPSDVRTGLCYHLTWIMLGYYIVDWGFGICECFIHTFAKFVYVAFFWDIKNFFLYTVNFRGVIDMMVCVQNSKCFSTCGKRRSSKKCSFYVQISTTLHLISHYFGCQKKLMNEQWWCWWFIAWLSGEWNWSDVLILLCLLLD